MLSLVVATCLSATLNAPKIAEVWEGTMQVEFVQQKQKPNGKAQGTKKGKGKGKKKGKAKRNAQQSAPQIAPQPARGKHQARQLDVTIKLIKESRTFTGEWIEGDRSLIIAGTIDKRGFTARPTAVKSGKWNEDVLDDLWIEGEIKQGVLTGTLYGGGKNRVRGGTFTVKKKE